MPMCSKYQEIQLVRVILVVKESTIIWVDAKNHKKS